MLRLLAALVVATLSLTACSSDSDGPDGPKASSGSSQPPASSGPAEPGPACGDIWKAGHTLPADYEVCYVKGSKGTQDVVECTDESKLVVFDNEMYARTGGEIARPEVAPLQDLPEYSKAYRECTGG